MNTPRIDYFRDLAGVRRHWNRVVLASPQTLERMLGVSEELLAVYVLLNRSCDSDGFATIAPSEIAARMVEPTRKVLEWIGTLIELEIIHLGICPDGARLLIAEWDEAEYQKASKGDCRE